MNATSILLAAAMVCVPAATIPAQNIAGRCSASEFRQFDFWIGSWEVRNPAGTLLGRNRIDQEARGCALVERWRGERGGEGVSINTFDPASGKWTQRWVGDGVTLWLEGGLEGSSMVLRAVTPRATPQGEVLDRITWTPLADGQVRQVWEMSADGGRTWSVSFEGMYSRLE